MKKWFYSLSRGKQIALVVLSLHVACLLFLSADGWLSAPAPKRRKVAVSTIVIAPPAPKTVPTPTQTKQMPAPPPKPAVAKAVKKQPPKPVAKQTTPQQQSILQEIENSLETISSASPAQTKSEIAVPIFHEPPPKDSPIDFDPGLNERIAILLQETLQLPEFGEVKIFLSINRLGRLESLEVLEAKSTKNAEFLKNRLPDLQFPCLNESTSLTVVFSNAI